MNLYSIMGIKNDKNKKKRVSKAYNTKVVCA